LVEAELDRRHSRRARMRPTDAAGFCAGWETLERLWDGTVERTRGLDPDLLHESVDGEWSFIQTLRHMALVTDGSVAGSSSAIRRRSIRWACPGTARTRGVHCPRASPATSTRERPSTRCRSCCATGWRRYVVAGLTEASPDMQTEPVGASGWPEPRTYSVRGCCSTRSTRVGAPALRGAGPRRSAWRARWANA
jgi:hypothetical protein